MTQPIIPEFAETDLTLPWRNSKDDLIGALARQQGEKTPLRLISSAKSWLCHAGVDRTAAILPVNAPEEVQKVSPLEASRRYLQHLQSAWNHRFPQQPLEMQQVTITVPASFDPAARELTAQAAESIGLEHLTLLEEPQSALYSWIYNHTDQWREQIKPGDIILVVDLGGGTTDLSLMAVSEKNGSLELNRIAVGNHILLGGDNMDLALAHGVKAKLAGQGTSLEPWQLQALTHACRSAKEALLSDSQLNQAPLTIPSRGSKLIGGSLRTELTRDELNAILVEGFFPATPISAKPRNRARTALTQLGLPYAQDAAITRHLAAFLSQHREAAEDLPGFTAGSGEFLHPSAILFNGGVLKADLLADRLLSQINDWLEQDNAPKARLLSGTDPDLAVARGAAYYGQVRQGRGIRIRGGTAKAYYVGIESAMPAVPGMEPPIQALCVAPFGMEEGTSAAIPPQELGVVVGEPVQFRFFGSATRRHDQVGDLLEHWSNDDLEELAGIEAHLPAEDRDMGDVVPVHLHATVTEVGTLQLETEPVDGGDSWKVEFNVRAES